MEEREGSLGNEDSKSDWAMQKESRNQENQGTVTRAGSGREGCPPSEAW